MLSNRFRHFLRDERGSYTVWSLVWFMLYVAIGGLAVDMTDAYRNQTLLQSTADAAALAGAISLPDEDAAVDQALAYAAENMNPAVNSMVLKDADVLVGSWSFETETFTTGLPEPDAVYAITRRAEENANPVAMNFLRILALFGLDPWWNINTEAIATRYVPDCLKNGLVSNNQVDVTSGNGFYNEICIHGQNEIEDPGHDYAIDINNNGTIEEGVQISMSDLDDMNGRPNVYDKNEGLREAMAEGDLWAKDAMIVDQIIAGLFDPDSPHFPAYIDVTTAEDGSEQPTVVSIGKDYAGPYDAGTIYYADQCQSNQTLSLPTDVVLEQVVIVAECKIKAPSGVQLVSSVVASRAKGNGQDPLDQHSIDLASNAQIGTDSYCTDGYGGVEIYSAASAHVAAGPDVNGLRAVVAGDFHFTADADVNGISVQAGDTISATANGSFGLCPGGIIPGHFAWQYRLVR